MRAKKLHVKEGDKWLPVFCYMAGTIVTCESHPQKALPPKSIWADDDLAFFSKKFANREFCLMTPSSPQ